MGHRNTRWSGRNSPATVLGGLGSSTAVAFGRIRDRRSNRPAKDGADAATTAASQLGRAVGITRRGKPRGDRHSRYAGL